ncbi:MAG: response regulator transcription factor [Planctomycetota bacterium]
MAKILIVDDDPDVVAAAKVFLEKGGHEVASAGSRPEGMSAIQDASPDLLILDVMMDQPDDGMVMAQELRRDGFKKPILMLTSIAKVTGMDFEKDDEILPVDEFQQKPIDPATLLAKVDELLKK